MPKSLPKITHSDNPSDSFSRASSVTSLSYSTNSRGGTRTPDQRIMIPLEVESDDDPFIVVNRITLEDIAKDRDLYLQLAIEETGEKVFAQLALEYTRLYKSFARILSLQCEEMS